MRRDRFPKSACEAAGALPLQPNRMLLLREPPDADSIALEAPPPGIPCCPCPEHHQSPLALAAKSFYLAVRDAAGAKFVSTNADCTVFVHGLSPSHAIGDSVAIFCKTGVVSEADIHLYTVLGVWIESDDGVDVKPLMRMNPDFGLPVVIKGGNPSAYLRLNAAVRLPEGDIHLAFTNATMRFRLTIGSGSDELTLLDTDEKPTLDLSLLKWLGIAAMTDYGDGAVVKLYAYGKGHVDLDFGYATANGQSGIRDSDRLRITAVEPLLVPDFNRDGSIDEDDFAMSRQGKTFRFWINDDNDSGDTNESEDDRPGSGPNHADDEVNGRCDFLDFTPVCIDIANAFPDDVPDAVKSRFGWRLSSGCLKSVWTGLSRAEAGRFQRDDCGSVFGVDLDDALLDASTVDLTDGVVLNDDFASAVTSGTGGIMLVEGCSGGTDLVLEGMILQDGVWRVVCEQRMKLSVSAVEDMYWFHSLYGAEQNRSFTPPVVHAPWNRWDAEECDKDVFFTHGFRVNEPDSHAWGRRRSSASGSPDRTRGSTCSPGRVLTAGPTAVSIIRRTPIRRRCREVRSSG